MTNTEEESPLPPNPNNNNNATQNDDVVDEQQLEEEEEEEEADEDEDDDVLPEPHRRTPQSRESKLREQRFRVETLARRLSSELVPIRVHDVVVNGNTKTKEWVIEAELKGIENATTLQDLMRACEAAIARLQRLEIFDSCKVRLESGPRELPNTANVVVDVVEAQNAVSGECGVYTKPSVPFFVLFSVQIEVSWVIYSVRFLHASDMFGFEKTNGANCWN